MLGADIVKCAVFGMKERVGKVKAMVINRTNKATLQGKIYNNIQAKSTVFTDDFRGYLGLKGFTHKTVNHSAKESTAPRPLFNFLFACLFFSLPPI
jgi:transposase-like protein